MAKGLEIKLNLDISKFNKVLDERLAQKIEAGAKKIVRTAKSLVPVRTGKLRGSIDYVASRNPRKGAKVFTRTGYGAVVELGWSRPGKGGKRVYSRRRPFLRPAVQRNRESIMRSLEGIL